MSESTVTSAFVAVLDHVNADALLAVLRTSACPAAILDRYGARALSDWQSDVPGLWWSHTSRDEIAAAVAVHPSTPASMLRRLHDRTALRDHVLANPSCPPALLVAAADSDDISARCVAVANPSCPAAQVEAAAHDPRVRVRSAAITNPACPAESRPPLWEGNARLRASAAEDPDTPAEVLARLAADTAASVRHAVATNPALPPETITMLADDPDMDVRRAVGRNPALRTNVLRELCRDDDYEVRAAVAGNPALPLGCLFEILATDGHSTVIHEAWCNPTLPLSQVHDVAANVLARSSGLFQQSVYRLQNTVRLGGVRTAEVAVAVAVAATSASEVMEAMRLVNAVASTHREPSDTLRTKVCAVLRDVAVDAPGLATSHPWADDGVRAIATLATADVSALLRRGVV